MSDLPPCPKCESALTYEDGILLVCPECAHEWSRGATAGSLAALQEHGAAHVSGQALIEFERRAGRERQDSRQRNGRGSPQEGFA